MRRIHALLCNVVIAIISRSLCARAMQYSWLHYQQVGATAAAAAAERLEWYLNPLNRCRSDSPLLHPTPHRRRVRIVVPPPPLRPAITNAKFTLSLMRNNDDNEDLFASLHFAWRLQSFTQVAQSERSQVRLLYRYSVYFFTNLSVFRELKFYGFHSLLFGI